MERVLCEEAGGWQDQIAAAFGGLKRIQFGTNGYDVLPVVISSDRKKKLNNNLLLFFTGFTRFSAELQVHNQRVAKNKITELQEMCQLVDDAEKILSDSLCDLDEFGRLLDYTWQLKKATGHNVSTDNIDEWYRLAINAGALGGKLLGAGGGGFLLFYVPEEKQEAVKEALKGLLLIPFSFEDGGTRVIYYATE